MIEILVAEDPGLTGAVALFVAKGATTTLSAGKLSPPAIATLSGLLSELDEPGAEGAVNSLPKPACGDQTIFLAGAGEQNAAGWRAAGAALARKAGKELALSVAVPPQATGETIEALCEGLWLGGYEFRRDSTPVADSPAPTGDPAVGARRLRQVIIFGPAIDFATPVVASTRLVMEQVIFARDLTNLSSDIKTPDWLAERVASTAVDRQHLRVAVWGPERLAAEGFAAVLAVGRASRNEPRLVELRWDPPGATRHVVLVGKGVTFDTGGLSLKPRESMRLMRKDMGGAATVLAATLGAAALGLNVRVTALAPLVENAIGADAMRPGDVIRHRGGLTTAVLNTDAEGRLILADVLAYVAEAVDADLVVDLATLTLAQTIALGKRTAALFTENDELAAGLSAASREAGEQVWLMPLPSDYATALRDDHADLANVCDEGPGAVMAALYLREFTGAVSQRWAHLDMSGPAWSDGESGVLTKGATGWGVRTLLRWLGSSALSGAGQLARRAADG